MDTGDEDDADWGRIASNDPGTTPSDLFHHSQQWSFVVYPASATPTGTIAFDSFRIIPEPMTLSLLAMGALAAVRWRRRA